MARFISEITRTKDGIKRRRVSFSNVFANHKSGTPDANLLVPKLVSFDSSTKSGYVKSGTKAFLPNGVRLRKGLPAEKKRAALRFLAENSDFFIKPLSARNKKIRSVLAQYGVKTEEVMQELGNGKALFRRTGVSLSSQDGRKLFATNPQKFAKALQKTFVTMLILEINHGHPHVGNFAITKKGEVIVLDLGRSRMGEPERVRKKMNDAKVDAASRELNMFCDSLWTYEFNVLKKRVPTNAEAVEEKKRVWGETVRMMKEEYPKIVEQIKQTKKVSRAQSLFAAQLQKG